MVANGQVVTGGGAPHTHAWAEVTGEPDFALQADLEALDTATGVALGQKADTGHTHTIGQVTGLQAELDSSATVAQLNATNSSVAALDTRVDALEVAPPAHQHAWVDITGEPTFALASDVTALDGRVDTLEAAPAAPVILKRWNGSAYVDAPDARVFVGDGDPGVMPEGSVWIGPE